MQSRFVEQLSITEYYMRVLERGRGLFQDRALRDEVAKLIKQGGRTPARSSIRGQNLHPEYVTDYVGILETGFGNTQYQTFWPVLYEVSVRR